MKKPFTIDEMCMILGRIKNPYTMELLEIQREKLEKRVEEHQERINRMQGKLNSIFK